MQFSSHELQSLWMLITYKKSERESVYEIIDASVVKECDREIGKEIEIQCANVLVKALIVATADNKLDIENELRKLTQRTANQNEHKIDIISLTIRNPNNCISTATPRITFDIGTQTELTGTFPQRKDDLEISEHMKVYLDNILTTVRQISQQHSDLKAKIENIATKIDKDHDPHIINTKMKPNNDPIILYTKSSDQIVNLSNIEIDNNMDISFDVNNESNLDHSNISLRSTSCFSNIGNPSTHNSTLMDRQSISDIESIHSIESSVINYNKENSNEVEVEDVMSDDLVEIGINKTKISRDFLNKMNYKSHSNATRKMLLELFKREDLASHSLTGRPSPAFVGTTKNIKPQLNPKIVEDLVRHIVMKCKVSPSLVRSTITTKCADENKMLKQRQGRNKCGRRPLANQTNRLERKSNIYASILPQNHSI